MTITVLDENDNPPQFNTSLVTVHVAEELPAPAVVGRVYALDHDLGVNRQISYFINQTGQYSRVIDAYEQHLVSLPQVAYKDGHIP